MTEKRMASVIDEMFFSSHYFPDGPGISNVLRIDVIPASPPLRDQIAEDGSPDNRRAAPIIDPMGRVRLSSVSGNIVPDRTSITS